MMKSEPRPFASLSSGLLARKGAARPAMRPQGFGQSGSGLDDLGWNDMGFEPPRPVLTPVIEDAEPAPLRPNPVTGLTPASPVHAVHEELAQRFGHEAEEEAEEVVDETAEPVPADVPPLAEVLAMPVRAEAPVQRAPAPAPVAPAPVVAAVEAPRSRRAASAKGKAAFTLRLDADRHLKLRLACAVTGTSAQQLVTRALDELLGSMPELDAMAERAPERAQQKR
jgi:hypothetical protein